MITKYIHKMFEYSFSKKWYKTYWAIDIHGTVLKPDYKRNSYSVDFYPFAKEVLQILSKRGDICLIMFTSTPNDTINFYTESFKVHGIFFNHINCNPGVNTGVGCFDEKFYFNVLLDDKAGFDPYTDWESIYNLLIEQEKNGKLPKLKWDLK